MAEAITYEQHGDVGLLILDDGKANAFSAQFIGLFNETLDRAEQDAAAVAIIGRPGLLSGGFDLSVVNSGNAQDIETMVNAGTRLLMRLYGHPQPVVVGATGHAVALGAFMLLSADYRIGISGDFKIGLNETAIGLALPHFGIELASARIAPPNLTQATLGATLYNPDGACEIGFLDETVLSENLRDTVLNQAARMTKLDGPAFAKSKQGLRGAAIARVLAGLEAAA